MAKCRHEPERETAELGPVSGGGGGGKREGGGGGTFSRGLCTVINLMSQVREMFSGPETNLHDCLDAFFDPSELKGLCQIKTCIIFYIIADAVQLGI